MTQDDPSAARRAQVLLRRFHDEKTPGQDAQAGTVPGAPPVPRASSDHPLDGGPRFAPGRLLGRGGGGEVWEIADDALRRRMAIKVQHASAKDQPDRCSRFLDEAAITAGLEHPGVLPVYDVGRTADGRLWFGMRQAVGTGLDAVIADLTRGGGPAHLGPVAERVSLFLRVCDAVAYAHSRGVIHRDLKPANIMLGSFGEVLVVDWGMAVSVADGPARSIGGTPLYMAPEQVQEQTADRRSDVYSLGLTLRQLVSLHLHLDPEGDADGFWESKRSGRLIPLPQDAASLPDDLLAIIDRAVDPDPGRRQADAAVLRSELGRWLSGREAGIIRERVRVRLAELAVHGNHQAFTGLAGDLVRAQELCADARNQSLLAEVRLAHAGFALDRGDLELARELAAGRDAGLEERIIRAFRRRRTMRRLGWAAAAIALCAVLGSAALLLHQSRARFGIWQTVWSRSFPADAGHGLVADASSSFSDARFEHQPGQVLRLPAGALLWIEGVHETGNVRIEADVRWPGPIDGLEFDFAASRQGDLNPGITPAGLYCQFAGWQGMRHVVGINYRAGQGVHEIVGWPEGIANDRTYRCTVVLQDDAVTLSFDGGSAPPVPVALRPRGPGNGAVAIRSWAPIEIRSLRIDRLGLPAQPTPLVVGDAFLMEGMPDRARRAYLDAARDQAGGALAEDALARAILAGCQTAEGLREASQLLKRLVSEHPGSRFLPDCSAVVAQALWRDGDRSAALALAAAELQLRPGSDIVRKLIAHRPQGLGADGLRQVLELAPLGRPIEMLDLQDSGLEDLSLLRGMPLRSLRLSRSPCTSLEPLRGMPLQELVVDETRIADLSPLAGMPLRILSAVRTPVADLSPLAGLPLRQLNLSGSLVTDLSALRGMALETLSLIGTRVAAFPPIACTRLQSLEMSDTQLADLGPLAAARGLRQLGLHRTGVRDLGPLRGLPELSSLGLDRTAVSDLGPLRGSRIAHLSIAQTLVADLSPLQGAPLRTLVIAKTPIRDLTPLAGMRLRSLTASGCALTDLALFQGNRFEQLDLAEVPVRDLSMLQADQVLLGRTSADPASWAGNPDIGLVHGLPTAERVADWIQAAEACAGHRPEMSRSLRIGAALAGHDIQGLRRLAAIHGGRRWLNTGLAVDAADASRLAASVGAQLPSLSGPEDQRRLTAILVPCDETESGHLRLMG